MLDREDATARAKYLRDLDASAPAIAAAVREMLAERDQLRDQPLIGSEAVAQLTRSTLAGQQLGAYTLESSLGHGGMGTVWLARRSDVPSWSPDGRMLAFVSNSD